MEQTPQKAGFRMPAEWEPQEAVWLAWPHNEWSWGDKLSAAQKVYCQFIKIIHHGQRVHLLVKSEEDKTKINFLLKKESITLSKIIFYIIPTVDTWVRDYGPTFLVNKEQKLAMVNWTFNAWGRKYKTFLEDDKIPKKINEHLQLPIFAPNLVLEGGSIEVNGQGLLLTSEQCLLNKNRNPSLSKEEIEKKLKSFLNVKKILWLKNGIVGDDTDGHIDDLARFVDENTVVCAYEDNPEDENHLILKENYDLLKEMTDQNGKKLKIIKLPMPNPVLHEGERLPASYTNFYIGNEVVVMPTFQSKKDQKALDILQKLFPKRKVIGVDCVDLVYGLGTLHCCSQQQPKGK
ncbi:MAG: agmatine deiminase family protein [Candidatus Woesearchaeota archaeon]